MKSSPLIVGLGELLWDLLPDGPQVGGAPANFSWMASQLGARGLVLSAVGADDWGKKLLAHLHRRKVDAGHIAILPDFSTGTVSVNFAVPGQPVYEIHQEVAWDHLPSTPAALELAQQADAVCIGTLAQRSVVSHATIQEFLDVTPPDCLRIFDINLRQNYYRPEIIRETLTKCQVLKLNQEEWPILAELLEVDVDFTPGLPQLRDRYGLQLVALTLGEQGSILASAQGLSVQEGVAVKVVDAIGAGDAFTAALAVGLLRGDSMKKIQQRASQIAAFVCSQAGATPVLPKNLKD